MTIKISSHNLMIQRSLPKKFNNRWNRMRLLQLILKRLDQSMPVLLIEEPYFTLSFKILHKLTQCINTHSHTSSNFLTWSLNRLRNSMMLTNEFKHFSQELPKQSIWTSVEDCLIFINWFSHSALLLRFKDWVEKSIIVSGIFS